MTSRMGDENKTEQEKPKESLLHRVGHFGATVGKKAPQKRSTKLIIQGGFAFLSFAFLVFTVVSQWSELRFPISPRWPRNPARST